MSFLSSGRILSSSRPRFYNRLAQTQSSASASTSFTTDSIGDADANYQSQINKPRASIHSSASAPDLSATTRLIREKMKISSDGGLAEQHTSFPHFDSQYKCCCNAIHVRFLSIIICIGLFIGCVNAIYKPDGYFGDWIQSYVIGQAVEVYSIDEKNEKRLEETVDMKLLIRLCATLSAIAFFISFLVTCWWLSVVYKCYRYFADMNRHREPFDRPVLYSVHYTNSAY
ncbi:hypothetical protein WR25_17945 [Diploscapter pachys]|uniref:Uncharacterized protein n=1 Tax=Diploscapter pachys TaxID=2018661 RepID=A0A2A2LCU6_9BILA|nr:hypothetical protein WR25_17945 [Diploscapter pachys]